MSKELLPVEQKLGNVAEIIRANPEVVGFQAYEYFRNNSASQKQSFICGELSQLDLDYPILRGDSVDELASDTLMALRMLMAGDRDERTEALYQAVEYRYSEMFLAALAARLQQDGPKSPERSETLAWFKQMNEALYGKPKQDVFLAIAHEQIDPLLNFETQEPLVSTIQTELADHLGDITDSSYEPFRKDKTTVDRVGQIIRERLNFLTDHVDPGATYDVAAMAGALEAALQKIQGQNYGWGVEITPNSASLAVSSHRKVIEVGENKDPVSGAVLQQLILHETGVHALRSINAERAGWVSATYGQDGYLDFEEALGTALEDAFSGSVESRGEGHYLTAGLAYGLDNHTPRDFREVYEIKWRIAVLENAMQGKPVSDELIAKACSKAFTQCIRLFRGTSTTDRGVVYLKDLAYFNGQELVWPLLAQMQKPEDLDKFLVGKLDLTREDHLKIHNSIIEALKNSEKKGFWN